MKRVGLPNKYPTESLQVEFDFISQLPQGQTISAAAVTAAVFSGLAGAATGLISEPASISGTRVTQAITGGTAGTIITLLCTATTSSGLSLHQQGFMAVLPTQP